MVLIWMAWISCGGNMSPRSISRKRVLKRGVSPS
jgi:hypothetical protein